MPALPLPPDATVAHVAARAFHNAAAHALVSTGRGRGYQKEVAAVVGSTTAAYSDAMQGRSPTLDRVLRWMAVWAEHEGLPELELRVTATGAVVLAGGVPFGPYGPV